MTQSNRLSTEQHLKPKWQACTCGLEVTIWAQGDSAWLFKREEPSQKGEDPTIPSSPRSAPSSHLRISQKLPVVCP